MSLLLSNCYPAIISQTETKKAVTAKIQTAIVNIHYPSEIIKNRFRVKAAGFSDKSIIKLKVSAINKGFSPISTTVALEDSKPLPEIILKVPPVNGVIFTLQGIDSCDNVVVEMETVENIKQGNNTIDVNWPSTSIAKIFKLLPFNTIDIKTLSDFILNDISGYNALKNTYTGVNPIYIDIYGIVGSLKESGKIPALIESFKNEVKGTVDIEVRTFGGINVTDSYDIATNAYSASVPLLDKNVYSVNGIGSGVWNIYATKKGSKECPIVKSFTVSNNKLNQKITITLSPPPAPASGAVTKTYSVQKVFAKTFSQPVFLTNANDDSGRIFVGEQTGKIFVSKVGTEDFKVFLDISTIITSTDDNGLLGFTFHPDYKNNGLLYVYYTTKSDPIQTSISSFKVNKSAPDEADISSEEVILRFDQPTGSLHKGGMLAFGNDGYLYIGSGDGGTSAGPGNNAQDLKNLLGVILRIDINNKSEGKNYSIPVDNPFLKNESGNREEIFAYGMRNPWRFSFDQETGRLWLGDVGENTYEEINLVESGKNYGWNIMEGKHCFQNLSCDETGLALPIEEVVHPDFKSITGGYVYRGSKFSELVGSYIYGDFIKGKISYLKYIDNKVDTNEVFILVKINIVSFGIDQDNEIYIVDYKGGIYQFQELVK